MRLSAKHANQQAVELADFSGGLNITNSIEEIQLNELNRCVNLELMGNLLRTVSGTKDLFRSDSMQFTDTAYDTINDLLLLCDSNRKVYSMRTDGSDLVELGSLTGTITPAFAAWEDGMLIASGGKLQYFTGAALATIETSPDVCNGVFISHGRVIVYYDDELHFSAVGDETDWTDEPNVDSSAKFMQVGYKDGGYITSVINLSSDLIVLKSNNRAFRIAGQYPNWQQMEISSNINVRSWRSAIALVNSAVVLGDNSLQALAPTDNYADMQATTLSVKVQDAITGLPKDVKLRFVPPLKQVWLISGDRSFMFMDVDHQAFMWREYNEPVMDVCCHGENVYILKPDAVCLLNNSGEMLDNGKALKWVMYAKTLVANYEYLVKRVHVDITPYFQNYADISFFVGHIRLSELVPAEALQIYHDYTHIYHSKRSLVGKPITAMFNNGDEIYGNDFEIYGNETYIKSIAYIRQTKRQLDRHKAIRIYGKGSGGRFILNRINFDLVEV